MGFALEFGSATFLPETVERGSRGFRSGEPDSGPVRLCYSSGRATKRR